MAGEIKDAESDVLFSVLNGVATIRLNRPQKFNGWREADTQAVRSHLQYCAGDASIKAAILTGTGAYYSAGADVFSSATLQKPSTMIAHITEYNEGVFNMFIDFPKPLIVAVNGPAVGMAVTQLPLMDSVLAAPTATFVTPFVKLGLKPEGCSSFTFPHFLGADLARRLLEEAEKLDVQEARECGLVTEIVAADSLQARAQAVAEEWGSSGRQRRIVEKGLVEKLKAVNKQESAAFGACLADRRFYEAQLAMAKEKGKNFESWIWWTMSKLVPPLSRL
eukprot:TRINITY_DN52928_c0_g1_i1.p1 TRINITY_DN52928_c0_g1~~TRINITY_DN52928_c0_g1_i1.p1  ORF type:complete len:278 (-),score=68.30 TRINITY_DN52928_c0_g1_i1:92-925(-)